MPELLFTNKGAAEAIRLQEQANEKARELGELYKKDARDAATLERAAKSIYESTKTPQQKMLDRIAKIKKAQKEGLIPPKEAKAALTGLNTKLGELEATHKSAFGSAALTRMTTFATGIGSIGTALALVTAEFQSQLKLIDDAAQTQISLVPSRQNLIGNLGGRPPAEIAKVLAKAQTLSLSRGVPEAIINNALSSGVSGSSGDDAAAIAAVDFVARLYGDRPDQIEQATGAILDLSGPAGSKDPKVVAGLLSAVSRQSRMVNPRQVAINAPKALVTLQGYGAERDTGGALFSTVSALIKDSMGEVTKTTLINLGKAVDQFDERLIADAGGKDVASLEGKLLSSDKAGAKKLASLQNRITKAKTDERRSELGGELETTQKELAAQRAELQGQLDKAREHFQQQTQLGKTFEQQPNFNAKLAMLQNSPELRKQFLSKPLGLPGEAIVPIRNLLDPSSGGAKLYARNRADIPDDDKLRALSEQSIKDLSIDPLRPVARAERQLAALNEYYEKNSTQNLSPSAREELQKALQRVGRSHLGAKATGLLGSLKDGELGVSISETVDILDDEAVRLRGRKVRSNAFAGPGAPGLPPRKATQEEIESAKSLKESADILRQMLEESKQMNRKLSETGLMGGAG